MNGLFDKILLLLHRAEICLIGPPGTKIGKNESTSIMERSLQYSFSMQKKKSGFWRGTKPPLLEYRRVSLMELMQLEWFMALRITLRRK